MDKFEISKELMRCFPNSFINSYGEFIAHKYANQYFILDNCNTEEDVKVKILSWFSRGAHKTEPYKTKKCNDALHKYMLNGINKYLNTNFTKDDISRIYTYFGNDCNKNKCYEFVQNNYDMKIIEELENR